MRGSPIPRIVKLKINCGDCLIHGQEWYSILRCWPRCCINMLDSFRDNPLNSMSGLHANVQAATVCPSEKKTVGIPNGYTTVGAQITPSTSEKNGSPKNCVFLVVSLQTPTPTGVSSKNKTSKRPARAEVPNAQALDRLELTHPAPSPGQRRRGSSDKQRKQRKQTKQHKRAGIKKQSNTHQSDSKPIQAEARPSKASKHSDGQTD